VNRAGTADAQPVQTAVRLKTALAIFPKLWGAEGYLRTSGYLFVVGHMRSYSSLLAHILGSHPRIAGYAEMHQKYRNWLDLLELNRKVERSGEKICAGKYVLDKILHPQVLAPRVLRRSDLRLVAIARDPRATLASILRIRAGGVDRVESAVEYYVGRMASLVRIAEVRRGDLLYLDGELLVERTAETLARLSEHLRLAPPLSGEYSTFRFTGAPKYGDPSEWIRSGRVVDERTPLPKIELTGSQAGRAYAAYERMRAHMSSHARTALIRHAEVLPLRAAKVA